MSEEIKTVEIPRVSEHEGYPGNIIRVNLKWVCPVCGAVRGNTVRSFSFDGSRRLGVDAWLNPCGHIDYYDNVREEAKLNGLNPNLTTN